MLVSGYSQVIQLLHTNIFFFIFFIIMVYYKVMNMVPVL